VLSPATLAEADSSSFERSTSSAKPLPQKRNSWATCHAERERREFAWRRRGSYSCATSWRPLMRSRLLGSAH